MSTFAIIVGVIIGTFIGWNIPQPQFAKDLQTTIKTKWDEFRAKTFK